MATKLKIGDHVQYQQCEVIGRVGGVNSETKMATVGWERDMGLRNTYPVEDLTLINTPQNGSKKARKNNPKPAKAKAPKDNSKTEKATRSLAETLIADHSEEINREIIPSNRIMEGVKSGLIPAKLDNYQVYNAPLEIRKSKKIMDVGDTVAETLRTMPLRDMYTHVAFQINVGVQILRNRYGNLNPGMQRMNLGNRLRGYYRKQMDDKKKGK